MCAPGLRGVPLCGYIFSASPTSLILILNKWPTGVDFGSKLIRTKVKRGSKLSLSECFSGKKIKGRSAQISLKLLRG